MVKKILGVTVLLGIAVFGVTAAVQNPQAVSLHYYFGIIWEGPVVLALLVAVIVGFVLGLVPGFFRHLSLRRQLRQLQRAQSRQAKEAAQPTAPQ